MKMLLHICCGPCAIYPLSVLQDGRRDVMGYFYRHNIHPFTECQRREETLRKFSDEHGLRVVYQRGYEPETFLRNVVYRETRRCHICYHERLTAAAKVAKKGKFDAFTSTLLYSRFQNHELIAETGEAVAKTTGVPFHYQDFRAGWKEGIEASKSLGMYRQQYCGCIFSEKERFYRPGRDG